MFFPFPKRRRQRRFSSQTRRCPCPRWYWTYVRIRRWTSFLPVLRGTLCNSRASEYRYVLLSCLRHIGDFVNADGCIANCLLKQHPEPEKWSHIDEHSQQPFASTRSTCVQWDVFRWIRVVGKSVPASIFLRFDTRLLFLWNAALSMMMTCPFGKQLRSLFSNQSSNTDAFIVPL